MKKLILGVLIGWMLNIASIEYQEFKYYDLMTDALDMGLPWRYIDKKGKTHNIIDNYIEHQPSTVMFKYINIKPRLYTCRFSFEHNRCLVKYLLRSPIPLKDRPKFDNRWDQ